ncbi:MAG: hypothetical protein JNK82_09070 [Myxococcaceae bacterium]|nr:hypothetical protein [Myxococcaceae bacterium]
MFPTTHGSAVQRVRSDDAGERSRAFSTLVAAYWKPAYKHLRLKWKQTPQGAEDTVQAFFARAFERDFFASYDPTKARFRTFFKLCLDRHQSNQPARPLNVDFAGPRASCSARRAAPTPTPSSSWSGSGSSSRPPSPT